jgi:hypothetical protein
MPVSSWLPASDGLLPYFLLYVSDWKTLEAATCADEKLQTAISAWIHSIVCYLATPSAALKSFSGPRAPHPERTLAHVYGVKNLYTSAIRLAATYHIDDPWLYDLAVLSFAGVLFLYTTELLIWKTVRLQEFGVPLITAGLGLLWMVSQRDWYTQH